MAFEFTPAPAGATGGGALRGRRGDERAERGDDRLQVRPRAGLVGVESAPHRRDMGGLIAATAADDARAAVDREAGVSAISSGVPE